MVKAKLSHPIFYDPAGRRRRWVRQVVFVFATVASALAAIFVASVLINPWLPRLNLRQVASLPNANDMRFQAPSLFAPSLFAPSLFAPSLVTPREQKARHAQDALRRALARRATVPAKRQAPKGVAPALGQASTEPLAIGFYVNWDDSSYQSLKRELARLDWVVPEWIRLQTGDDPVVGEIDPRALDLIRREKPNTPIIPMIHNSEEGKWDVPALAQAVGDEVKRRQVINALANFVESNRFQGVCVDFEEVPSAAQPTLLLFMQELRGVFHPRGWIVAQAAPFDDSDWDYCAYAAANDYLMLMAYDEHWADSAPGSVAGQQWFEETLARRMSEIPGNRAVVCIGGYGYDWSPGRETAEMTFQEAVLAARDCEAKISFDPATRNPYFRYREEDNSQHMVWFLDAVTAFNQMRAAMKYQPAGFALWRLGSEDPSLWSVFGTDRMNAGADGLREIKYGYDVDFEGAGEILQVEAEPQAGSREVTVNSSTGLIGAELYTAIPSSYVIRRNGYEPGLVALTFDDGPDPAWTPRILDILKQEGVPASFFIIGQNGQANPDLVKRIVAEGHEIGNHSFTHPNMGEIPGRLTDLELNATQRLIESLTGRSTRLFRPPYFGDAEPTTPDEIEPVTRAERLGYLTIGLRVDPGDWTLPGANAIVERTIGGVTGSDPDQRGQVVLLHDGGGDRAQTLEALPELIQELRARGYRFVRVSELAGLTRDQAMPLTPPGRGFFSTADVLTFYTFAFGGWALRWLFLIGIGLGLSRLFFIGALALGQRLRARRGQVAPDQPFVSILVPAYNEEKVIAQTIDSLLASTYPRFEIIVVDDGSFDRTAEVVRDRYTGDTRVRLFVKENGGKAEALNYGLRQARGEIIVTLDADTIFQPDTVSNLARRFGDPKVGAVAGNAKVGNRINLITRWQALEYVTSQNLDRRAFAALNCITVVPGAVGAWRREALERAGGLTSDTLAEDQDLTLKARRMGYEVGYEENAVAWTEAPDTLKGLAKQRFRWSFGTLQCMWKHRDALFRMRYGALGWVGAPNVWVFQILFPMISPVVDLMFVWTLISAGLERLEHRAEFAISNLGQVMFYYALFLAVDWLAAVFAFLLEKREQWGLLLWLFLQRFCYRQVMYYVMVKSIMTALRGALVGWGNLERKATVAARTLAVEPLVSCGDRQ